ncbi:MAG: hypothetical protein AMXMBFR7_36250 [Planctomycetota bacterium]
MKILLLTPDQAVAEALQKLGRALGYTVAASPEPGKLAEQIPVERPDVLALAGKLGAADILDTLNVVHALDAAARPLVLLGVRKGTLTHPLPMALREGLELVAEPDDWEEWRLRLRLAEHLRRGHSADEPRATGGAAGMNAKAVMECIDSAMLILDADTGEIVESNSRALDWFGLDLEQLMALGSRTLRRDPVGTNAVSPLDEALAGRRPTYEWDLVTKSGRRITGEIALTRLPGVEPRLVLISAHDISERKRAEAELRRSAEEYHRLFEAANDAILVFEPKSGRIMEANERTCHMYGYERHELVGSSVAVFCTAVKPAEETVREILEADGKEIVHRKKSGHPICVEVNATPANYQGRAAVLAIHRDVTERKRAEESLRLSQKMEAIGQLAGGVAHDFNNLLLTISGNAELLMRITPAEGAAREHLDEILLATHRATDLTRQLLAFGRRQVLSARVLDLNALIGELLKMLRRLIPESILIEFKAHPELGFIKADPAQIQQVVMNLAVNARDAMPQGGRIILRTRNADLHDGLTRREVQVKPGRYAVLEMEDSGVGMDPAVLNRIFEPFFTTKSVGQGTGLGLSTAYGIVKQSGGYIFADSEPGKGARFEIYLPRVEGQAMRDGRRTTTIEFIRGNETVLLAEDEPSVRDLAKTVLSLNGYTVLDAEDGLEALNRALEHPGAIQLLITDVVMPNLGGLELAEKLRERFPEMRILFTSGYTADSEAVQPVPQQHQDFLQKPYSLMELLQKVRKILDTPAALPSGEST